MLLADGRSVPADIVVVGIGAGPAVDWLDGIGLDLERRRRVRRDGRTSLAGVVAVGDCAGLVRRRPREATTASSTGPARGAARRRWSAAMLGGPRATGALRPPYFWSDQYGVKIQFAGTPGRRPRRDRGGGARGDRRRPCRLPARPAKPVAVLGMNQPRLFTRWRKQLAAVRAATCCGLMGLVAHSR